MRPIDSSSLCQLGIQNVPFCSSEVLKLGNECMFSWGALGRELVLAEDGAPWPHCGGGAQ